MTTAQPKVWEHRDNLGQAYAQNDQWDKAAVEYTEAMKLNPNDVTFQNKLGVAYYRAGSWEGSIAALEKSMAFRQGGDSSDWFFLAMAHQHLGHTDEARKWHAKAVEWMEKNQTTNEELLRYRREAAELLGIPLSVETH